MARLYDDSKRKRSAGYVRILTCQVCTKGFRAERADAKYCSDKCRQKAARARRRPQARPCVVCGEWIEYPSANQLYCSAACKQRAYRAAKAGNRYAADDVPVIRVSDD